MNDLSCPFLVVVEHTHMISRKHYGGDTIVYVGSYREPSDPVLNYTKRRLLNLYHPYLEKLSPGYRRHIKKTILSFAPFAQPIMDVGYNQRVPSFQTPHRHVYLANIDMIYPWDRGTNYAIALGKRVALCIMESHESAPST